MPLRRSARRTKLKENEPAGVENEPQPVPVQPKESNKRKAATSDSNPKVKTVKTTTKTQSAASRKKKTPNQTRDVHPVDRLSILPSEILFMVIDNVKEKAALSRLSRTCKRYYSLITPKFYERIAVAAMYHAHIAKLIRTLEPHLTIQQRKQLKKEGTYRGQKELYPSNIRPDKKPACAGFVRQLVIGSIQPGRKHEDIVHRYVEEALKNTNNVQAFEALHVTESMAHSIASFEKLQALSLDLSRIGFRDYPQLYEIKNLKHLALAQCRAGLVHSIMLNSRSSLLSLDLNTGPLDFLNDWDGILGVKQEPTDKPHYLTALKSFSVQASQFDQASVSSLKKAIDFVGLQELEIKNLPDHSPLLFQELADLFTKASASNSAIHLQSLTLDMGTFYNRFSEDQNKAVTDVKCRFLSSFNTLKALDLIDFGQYPLEVSQNPGLPSNLVQAILQHKGLEKLSISYTGMGGHQIPWLKPDEVATLIDNLPHLRQLHISPEETNLDELGQVLSRGSNIESITFSCTRSWAFAGLPQDPTNPLRDCVLKGFLSRDSASDTRKSKWEENCKLKRLNINSQIYEMASKFGRGGKGIAKAEKFTSPGDPQREVMYRNITGTSPIWINVGLDPTFTWLEKVSKDLD